MSNTCANAYGGLNVQDKSMRNIQCNDMYVQCSATCADARTNNATLSAETNTVSNLTTKDVVVGGTIVVPETSYKIEDQYFSLGQFGDSSNNFSFDPPMYMSIMQIAHYESDLTNAFHFIMPFAIKELRTDFEMQNGTPPVGNLFITAANIYTGTNYAGTAIPSPLDSFTSAKGAHARHILSPAIPANTPFAIKFSQHGPPFAEARYRFLHKVLIAN